MPAVSVRLSSAVHQRRARIRTVRDLLYALVGDGAKHWDRIRRRRNANRLRAYCNRCRSRDGHRESSQLCVQPMPARCGAGRADRSHGCLQLDLFVAIYFGVVHVCVVAAVACHRSFVRRAANPVPRLVAMLITARRANFIDSAMKSAMAQSVVGVAVVVPSFERRL